MEFAIKKVANQQFIAIVDGKNSRSAIAKYRHHHEVDGKLTAVQLDTIANPQAREMLIRNLPRS